MENLIVCGVNDPGLAQALTQGVESRIASGKYTRDEVRYLSTLERKLFPQDSELDEELLNRFRRLCLFSNVELHIAQIRSHRKFIGPIIVAVKKLVFPILKLLLKDFLRQQRQFNAEVVAALADVHEAAKKRP